MKPRAEINCMGWYALETLSPDLLEKLAANITALTTDDLINLQDLKECMIADEETDHGV